jgi:cytochrome P450
VPVLGHLPAWTFNGLRLLERGAALGDVFEIRLWRKAVVGSTPDWNRFVLGDLAAFRSRGSLSQLSPYLSAGVVATDVPEHKARRAALNPSFHRRPITERFAEAFAEVVAQELPTGPFEATAWAARVVRRMIQTAFVGPAFPAGVLERFVAPLDRPMPGPLLRRPVRIRRTEAALRRSFADPDPATLAPLFASLPDGVAEARVALAAAYDTTAHTLAFALWELAARPDLNDPARTAAVVDETLRLYPAGWISSRVTAQDVEFDGIRLPAGRLVLTSPWLTHRDERWWPDATTFRPERFTSDARPAWGYLPFSAGERTCLGAGLATLMIRSAVGAFAGSTLRRAQPAGTADPVPVGGLTLTPSGPVRLERHGGRPSRAEEAAATAAGGAVATCPVAHGIPNALPDSVPDAASAERAGCPWPT